MLSDLRHAIRGLRQSPALFAVAVASLAFGIGANVTVFSIVREMIFDDLSARHPGRLAVVDAGSVSYTAYRTLRSAGAFEDLAFHRGLHDRTWQRPDSSEIVWTVATSENFFDVLGIRASAGRLYARPDEGREFAVVSHGFWRKRAGGKAIVGQSLRLNGKLYEVAGILPRDYRSLFGHGVSPEIYISDPGNADPQDRGCRLFGRLRDGFSREQTRQALAAAAGGRVALSPMSGLAAHAAGQGEERLFLLFLLTLLGLAGMLTLIACANVAGLLLARALGRRRDLAIRQALGAGALQLARPLVLEGAALVVAGASAALLLDAFLRDRLSYVRWPTAYGLPFEFHFTGDAGLAAYAGGIAFAAFLLSSIAPAWRSSRQDLASAIRQAEPGLSLRRGSWRGGFVFLQVALSMTLLTLGAVFTSSFLRLAQSGPGFDVGHTLIATVHAPGWDLRQRVVRRVQAVPGVVSVTSTGILPLMGELPDAELRRDGEPLSAIRHTYAMPAGENFCATLGIELLRGRDFTLADRELRPIPVIVNRTLARRFFGDTDPVGAHLRRGREPREDLLEIVGVAADTKMRTLGEGSMPQFFYPGFNTQLLVRVAGPPPQWIEPLRTALRQVDPAAALSIRPMEEAAAGALFPMRMASAFVGALSVLGLALALVGLYGSVSSAVGRRTREFGIRAALGASRASLVAVALRNGVAILVCGAAAGALLAASALRPLAPLLPAGVNPWNPIPFAAVFLLLLATGAAAGWIPARRAASVDPSVSLRQE